MAWFAQAANNFFDAALISAIPDAFEELDRQTIGRRARRARKGRLRRTRATAIDRAPHQRIHKEAARLFPRKPVIATAHRPAIGGGPGGEFSRHLRAGAFRRELQPPGL
jgi:enoyl-CoA hydratase/carnithine racemase